MAKSKLFPQDSFPVASQLAELIYCNPFESRRQEIERACLGSGYRDPSDHGAGALASRSDNLQQLVARVEGLLGAAREKLAKAPGAATPADLEVYENLVHFHVYSALMERFDRLIDRSLSAKSPIDSVDFFYHCRDQLRFYFEVAPSLRIDPEVEGVYFSFYFQIRRAWVNIYRFIVGGSEPINALRARIWRSSFTRDMRRYRRSLYDRMGDIVTLITGPSGTGKELIARAVGLSRYVPFDWRKGVFAVDFHESFYPLNLSALSPTLIESELFGHRKGAFTGALQDRKGYLEECGEFGTVFLDEIGETDPSIQVKLLRVLQTRQFQRIGDTRSRPFVGKVMAATNRDLPEEIRKGSFREDFYFRLCADRIEAPSLASCLAGNAGELERFVAFIAERVAGPDDGGSLASESIEWICENLGPSYRWPGNFRELEQCVRSVLVHGCYEAETLGVARADRSRVEEARATRLTANQMLSLYAQSIYRECGSFEEASRILNVDRRTAKRYVQGVD